MTIYLTDRGRTWEITSGQLGWFIAKHGDNVIMERTYDKVVESVRENNPSKPRVDAVAFAEGVGIVFEVNNPIM